MKAGQKINMKYLIIGAGGTGGVTGYYMKKAGKDVTLILLQIWSIMQSIRT